MKNTLSVSKATFIGLLAIILLILPFFSNAYFTTAQDQIDLGNSTGLFLIEYKFGAQKYDIHIPIQAAVTEEQQNDTVSYEILDREDNAVSGDMFGIVLSDTPINEDGMYVIPKGTSGTFTLAVFFTPEDSADAMKYRLHVKHLPFQFDGTQQLQLNPSELKYYVTEPLKL